MTTGLLRKMFSTYNSPIDYALSLDKAPVPLTPVLGQRLRLEFTGKIHCVACGRKTNKSFDEGYCFPCSQSLAQCDMCIVRPERCHFDAGTCREPDWGMAHCMQPHIVYLANSSGLKVGITRQVNLPTRWIDQGAVQALPILQVKTRYQSGLVEVAIGQHVADKTDWRKMLKGEQVDIDLHARRDELLETCRDELTALRERFGADAIQALPDAERVELQYPVLQHPVKVTSLNLDKVPVVEGTLLGIKGQYLMLDTGVINIRKYSGYQVTVQV